MRKNANIIVLIFATLAAAVGAAHAHSRLLSSKPAAGEIVSGSPDRVELFFSVLVQPAMTSITVTGSDGTASTVGPVGASSDGKTVWVFPAVPLGPGEYKVEWRALSADEHVIKGDFSFRVREAVSAYGPPPDPQSAQTQDHALMDHSSHSRTEAASWPQSLARWLLYLGIMLLTGGLAFRLYAAPYGDEAAVLDAFDRRAAGIFIAAAAISLAASITALALQTVTVFESVSLGAALSIISETSYGPPWILQVSSAATVFVLSLIARSVSIGNRTLCYRLAFVGSLLMLVSPPLTGHARAASADYGLAVPIDWLHLAAGAVWIGGLAMLVLAVPTAISAARDKPRSLSAFVSRFNKLAIWSVLVVAATGLYNSWIHIENFGALLSSAYGQVLLAKVVVTLLMVAIGGANAYIIHPRIAAGTRDADKRLFRNVTIEVALAIIVLLLAALLAFMPPAREHTPASVVRLGPAMRGYV